MYLKKQIVRQNSSFTMQSMQEYRVDFSGNPPVKKKRKRKKKHLKKTMNGGTRITQDLVQSLRTLRTPNQKLVLYKLP